MYQGNYELIGSGLSLFTRKLEAQLRFQQIPWRYQFKTQQRSAEFEAGASSHFIPLLQTPDRWLLNDTIAIGPLLNDRFGDRAVIPSTPVQRATCFILEDAFNHWLGEHEETLSSYTNRLFATPLSNSSPGEPMKNMSASILADSGKHGPVQHAG